MREGSRSRLFLKRISHKQGVQVFNALDMSHRRRIVLKVQTPTECGESIERFRREAIALSMIDHPNVISLYDYSDAPPRTMELEYVGAPTLAKRVAAQGVLRPDAVCRFVQDIASALDCCHACGILHRDIKPDNILLPARGRARLIDFGAAKIVGEPQVTLMGQAVRTHAYACPEQAGCEPSIDARGDVFSLAAVAFFALTGQPPVGAEIQGHQRPKIPSEIAQVIATGMSINVANRFQTAGQFASALRVALDHSRASRRPRRWFAFAWPFGVTVGLVICSLFVWHPHEHRRIPPHSVIVSDRDH